MNAVRRLATLAFAALLTGCSVGAGRDYPQELRVVEGDPSSVRTPIVGASPRQERILREILAGVGTKSIRRITVKRAGKEFRPHPADAVGIVFRHRDDFESYWHSWIVGQAFADRSSREALPSVVYIATKGEASRVSAPRMRPTAPPSREDAARLAKSLSADAQRAGAELSSLELLRPYGTAIAISLRVAKPARFLAEHYDRLSERALRLVERFRAALMLLVQDEGGRLVAARAGIGGGPSFGAATVAEKYEGCTSLGFSTPLGYRPPPCPLEPR